MHPAIAPLQQQLEESRKKITEHNIYHVIETVEDLKVFMKYHVFAVWDFMSLLKSLQNQLTCTSIPWVPKGHADTRFLINEIVVGEESDVDEQGQRTSHFELYLKAMQQAGADINTIQAFIAAFVQTGDLEKALAQAPIPTAAANFVRFTFEVIHQQAAHVQAAVFTFGREDLIPGMFYAMINDLNKNFSDSIATFKYYLERHIEVDGDHHSQLALQMTASLCGEDAEKWAEATAFALASLQKRILLWDGAYEEIVAAKTLATATA